LEVQAALRTLVAAVPRANSARGGAVRLAWLGDGQHRAGAQGAFDAFAMGNYPYASHYIGGSADHPLPAWPMRAACAFLAEPRLPEDALLQARWNPGCTALEPRRAGFVQALLTCNCTARLAHAHAQWQNFIFLGGGGGF